MQFGMPQVVNNSVISKYLSFVVWNITYVHPRVWIYLDETANSVHFMVTAILIIYFIIAFSLQLVYVGYYSLNRRIPVCLDDSAC